MFKEAAILIYQREEQKTTTKKKKIAATTIVRYIKKYIYLVSKRGVDVKRIRFPYLAASRKTTLVNLAFSTLPSAVGHF